MGNIGSTTIKALEGVIEDYYVYYIIRGYKPEFVRRILKQTVSDKVGDMESIIK